MAHKTLLERLIIGLKKGWALSTLPDDKLILNNHPLIRILRFTGGLSFIIVLGRTKISYPEWIWNICFVISILFTIYHIYICFYRIKHIRHLIKTGQADIRNSPLDNFSSWAVRALLCFKGACDVARPIGMVLGAMISADHVLQKANRPEIFGPFLGQILNSLTPGQRASFFEKNAISQLRELTSNGLDGLQANQSEIDNASKILTALNEAQTQNDLTQAEYTELTQAAQEYANSLENDRNALLNGIIKALEDAKKK